MRELKFGLMLAAFMIGFIIVYQPVDDFFKSIPYKFSHKNSQVLPTVSPELKDRFDRSATRGDFADDRTTGVYYSSFYDQESRAYFYLIANYSNAPLYARSDIFLVFLGRVGIKIGSEAKFCVKVEDPNPPVERREWLYVGENDVDYYGAEIKLVMPREKSEHRLMWRP